MPATSDKALESFDKLIDEYVEIYIGKYGRPKLTAETRVLRMQTLTDAGASKLIQSAIKHMLGPMTKKLNPAVDSDLINLRDEMVGLMNQFCICSRSSERLAGGLKPFKSSCRAGT